MRILTENFNTPYHSAPFGQISNADYLPAFKELIQKSEDEIEAIVHNTEEPSFENVIEALAYSGEQLDERRIFFSI